MVQYALATSPGTETLQKLFPAVAFSRTNAPTTGAGSRISRPASYLKCAPPLSSAVQRQPARASLSDGVSPGRDSCLEQQGDCENTAERGATAHRSWNVAGVPRPRTFHLKATGQLT